MASASADPDARAPAVPGLIGRAPSIELNRCDAGPYRLFLKRENQNPAGSIKDLTRIDLLNHLRRRMT